MSVPLRSCILGWMIRDELTFPDIVEAEFLRPDSNHAPDVEEDYADCHGVEHGFGRQAEAFLDVPEAEDSYCLGCYADDEQVGEVEGVVGDDGVLESPDDGDGCVEGVAEEEVAW